MDFVCKKCGSVELECRKEGVHTGLWCSDCGRWVKWLNKDEFKIIQMKNKKKTNDEILEEILSELRIIRNYLSDKNI